MRIWPVLCLTLAACAGTLPGEERDTRHRLEALLLGQRAAATAVGKCNNQAYCIIFRTSTTYAPASIGGLSGADTKCNADISKPSGTGTYKAILTDDASTRIACTSANCGGGPSEHTDWVLYALTEYRQVNQASVICTTNANGICPIGTATNGWDGTANQVHSGFNSDWTRSMGNTCTSWTGAGSGVYADSISINANMLFINAVACGAARSILCAQQ